MKKESVIEKWEILYIEMEKDNEREKWISGLENGRFLDGKRYVSEFIGRNL